MRVSLCSRILLFLLLNASQLSAQEEEVYKNYEKQLETVFNVHHQVKKGTPWPEILRYLKQQPSKKGDWLNPQKSDLIGSIQETMRYRSRFPVIIKPDTASIDALLALLMDHSGASWYPKPYDSKTAKVRKPNFFIETADSNETVLTEIMRRGRSALPDLIRHLADTAATRSITDNGDSSQEIPYAVRLCDVVLNLIEAISLCDFLDHVQGHILSAEQKDVQQKVRQNILDWWAANKEASPAEGIRWQLENRYFSTEMCDKLDALGEKALAIQLLKAEYEKKKAFRSTCFPFISDLNIARFLEEKYNVDVALEDCANGVINYRCMNVAEKAAYIMRHDSSGFWFMALREVVATEPYSTYAANGEAWKYIFSQIVTIDKDYTLPVLIQLMKRKDPVFGPNSRFYTGWWTLKYPDAEKNKFRVCDLALLRWRELVEKNGWLKWTGVTEFLAQIGPVDLGSEEARDGQIGKIVERYEKYR